MEPVTTLHSLPASLGSYAESWFLHLRAENRSPRTISLYISTLGHLAAFLDARGMPTDPTVVSGEHVREYLANQLSRGLSAKTVRSRYSFLSVFFRWMVDEGEITASPMARIKPPQLDDTPPPIVTDDQYAAMLKVTAGRDFGDRRDMAILRLLEDTGIRRAECAAITVDDLDLVGMTVTVMGKGRKVRMVPFTATTAEAISRYMRERDNRRHARSGALFLARTGPMSPNAVGEVIYRLARLAGLVDSAGRELVSPHMFRHRLQIVGSGMVGTKMDLWRSEDGATAKSCSDTGD